MGKIKSMRKPSEESKTIDQMHDQWCRDNGYPVKKKKIDYSRKTKPKKNYKLGHAILSGYDGTL